MINEEDLKLIKRLAKDSYSPSQFIGVLHENMRGRDSCGGYASVFIPNKKPYVVKVILRGDNNAYVSYARFAKKFANQYQNLPQVYEILTTKHLQVFILEKLSHNYYKSNSFAKKYMPTYGSRVVATKSSPVYPILKKINSIIRHSNNRAMSDVGGDNIMFRKDGTAVITDPVAD